MTAHRNYIAVAEDAGDGSWSAYVPDLPGCTAGGATPDEALENVRVSVQLWLEEAKAHNEELPEAKAKVRQIATTI